MERAKKLSKRIFPVINWLPKYNLEYAVRDLIAGLTVGLTVIPQGLAYAILAGLPSQYGLYSSFMGVFVYCFGFLISICFIISVLGLQYCRLTLRLARLISPNY